MDLLQPLHAIRSVEDLPRLVEALGHEPLWERLPDPAHRGPPPAMVVGRNGDFPWIGLSAPDPERGARSLARRLASRGRLAGVLALGTGSRRLAVAVALDGVASLQVALDAPDPVALRCLVRLAGSGAGALAYAVRAAEALAGEAAGRRFFQEFRATLDHMAGGLPGPIRADDRQAFALLQLTRVLFLYFVQAKGWLAGRERFLADAVDGCLRSRRHIHRDLLRPLFFGTLNRPAAERSRTAAGFGAIPFLNGGLFEPHPIERRLRCQVPNELWREAFDRLFERFHFTVAEGAGDGRIAPDMLGRVFEGVMAPDARRATGTYYTPAALVRELLEAALVALVAHRAGTGESEAARMLADRSGPAREICRDLTILDPAVGSGAFLLGALEQLTPLAAGTNASERRRTVLQRNLFGVDLSSGAVRLTELRLWLAVIADDPAARPDLVLPLPNLDCLVRQGDSLFDPLGASLRLPFRAGAIADALAEARSRVVTAAGRDKRTALRRLAEVELRATATSLEAAEAAIAESIADCLREARSGDLFGTRRGLDTELRERLTGLRRQLHAVRRAARTVERDGEVPWFHYRCHFADVFARGGFDLVVGNPPWIRAEDLPAELRRRLGGRYRWWRSGGRGYANRPDLAVAFLERGLELAAPGGHVALLVPAKLATAGYGAAARHGLATTTTLIRLADLSGRPEAAFEATVYPMAVVARRTRPPPKHRVGTGLEPAGPTVRQSRLNGGAPWVLTREPLHAALAALGREHPALETVVTGHLGLKTGANALFLDPPAEIEPEVIRHAVRGRDLRPFRADSLTRLLYTHGADGRPRRELPPRAMAWLAPHLGTLKRRADFSGGPPWTLFRTGPATAPHRVVWSDLARRLSAAALTGARDRRLVPLNTCYVAPMRSEPEAERLAAWLNSTWLRAAARAGAVPAAGGFARFTATAIGRLPLPTTVLACPSLTALAAAGRRGEPVQEELDATAAHHLALSARACSALRYFLAECTHHRG